MDEYHKIIRDLREESNAEILLLLTEKQDIEFNKPLEERERTHHPPPPPPEGDRDKEEFHCPPPPSGC